MNLREKIALGTVQFGLNYGINNKTGEVSKNEMSSILNFAFENGVDTLDTATAYGNSESKLGNYFKSNPGKQFNVITKFPPKVELSNAPLQESLIKLGLNSVYGYMAHDFKMFGDSISEVKKFLQLKETGSISKIGFSLYYPSELKFLLENEIEFDIVQVPFNVFDQRFAASFKSLKEKGVEVHVRSCFLQGLVFKTPESLPEKLQGIAKKLKQLIDISIQSELSIQALCINFCLSNAYVDKVVLGVDSLNNLKENIKESGKVLSGDVLEKLEALKEENEKLILPLNW
ncbi:MAG: aldo/keto reductase [Sphingobacteriaceae bacterium]|nr:aldo/keto reductase [Sphingobacteriaceae bacterium]